MMTYLVMERCSYLIPLLLVVLATTLGHSAHLHHTSKQLTKERVEDGNQYLPRDRDHYTGDEHHNEFDHEAILGSVKDAEEFDHLPPDEAKRRLRILVTKMDLNKDEFVDRQELHAWILRSFKTLAQEEADERFLEADANGDGTVTWEEYFEDAYGDDDDLDSLKLSAEELRMVDTDKIMFKAADTDKNGVLTKEEYVPFTHPEEHPDMLPIILQNTLSEKDTNKDGEIDFQEFLGDDGKSMDKETLLIEKEKFDHEYDKNKDGKLVGSEILSWVVPSNDEIAEEETEHLISQADENKDRRLSYDEIVEHHDVFVGSEATDYGTHLHNIDRYQDEL